LQHYPADTPVAICFRLGWPDEKIWLVRLDEMADVTHREDLIRTTMYVISPALAAPTVPEEFRRSEGQEMVSRRSRLYNPEHTHLFRDGTSVR
jgi:precorrin-4/cobalt-precorrin-4 C11-methyltransferase